MGAKGREEERRGPARRGEEGAGAMEEGGDGEGRNQEEENAGRVAGGRQRSAMGKGRAGDEA
eukprot:6193612-Pleurochrysis_carterae.AAC.2